MLCRTFIVSLLGISLTGCISLLPNAGELAPRLSLDPGGAMATKTPAHSGALVVMDPDAAAILNTFSVAVATGPYQYEYLADAEWTDRVPVLLRRFLEQRFENHMVFEAVGNQTEFPVGGYKLYTDVRAFHLDRTGKTPTARIAYGARLLDKKGKVLGVRVFSAAAHPNGTSQTDTARALNEAAATVSDETVAWVRALVAQ
ncbi:MAG: ABC-type transport auxiliary lipoprotein family protein [Pseudomonadota bacterium]